MFQEWLAIGLFVIGVSLTAIPIGRDMARVFTGQRTMLDPVLGPIDRLILAVTGARGEEQSWLAYSRSLVLSNLVMWVIGYAILLAQALLPLNPDGIGAMEPTLAFNTISSFVTNTNLSTIAARRGSRICRR